MPPEQQKKQIHIAILGLGGVGQSFITQLSALAHRHNSNPTSPVSISLIYIARSQKALLASSFDSPLPFSLSTVQSSLESSTTPPLSLPDLAAHLASVPLPGRCILIDNTTSQPVAEAYPHFLSSGVSVITPSKKAFSSPLSLWDAIFSSAANGTSPTPSKAGHIYHESSVGAGLPVISTLKDLLETGDEVKRIEGVFSGTMSYLFNTFTPSSSPSHAEPHPSFSAVVASAKQLGYTEPDPRDDLNGLDVARKLVILARLAGLNIPSTASFPVQSLIPDALASCVSSDEFLARLPDFDAQLSSLRGEAEEQGKVLRYVGSIDVTAKKLAVSLQKVDKSSAIGALKGSDNAIAFHTARYGVQPLVVQGAGAGGEVTAMGVTGDLIKCIGVL